MVLTKVKECVMMFGLFDLSGKIVVVIGLSCGLGYVIVCVMIV